MQVVDERAVARWIVEFLAGVAEARLADAFKSDEQACTSAARGEFHQFAVAAKEAGRKTEPADFERDQGFEQFASIGAIRDEIEVDKDDAPFADAANIVNDMADGFL